MRTHNLYRFGFLCRNHLRHLSECVADVRGFYAWVKNPLNLIKPILSKEIYIASRCCFG